MGPGWVDEFPIKSGDVPARYVSLPEGNQNQGVLGPLLGGSSQLVSS